MRTIRRGSSAGDSDRVKQDRKREDTQGIYSRSTGPCSRMANRVCGKNPAGEPRSLGCDLHTLLVMLPPLHTAAESSCNRNWKRVSWPALSWETGSLWSVSVEADKPVSKIDMENKGPKNSQTPKKNKLETGGNVFRVCSEVIVKTTWGGASQSTGGLRGTTEPAGQ